MVCRRLQYLLYQFRAVHPCTLERCCENCCRQYAATTHCFDALTSQAILNIILRPEIEGMKDKTGIPTTITQWDVVIQANPAPEVKW